jgi:hypothetical protein
MASAGRDVAQLLHTERVLPAGHAALSRGFQAAPVAAPAAPSQGAEGGGAAGGGLENKREGEASARELSACILGLWRVFAAYGLAEPPLGTLFPLLSQVCHRSVHL